MTEIIEDYNKNNHFGVWMEMNFNVLNPGEIEYHMEVKKHHQAIENVAHGGSIAAMMDGVLGVAAFSAVAPEGKHVATVEFKINYLNPAIVGDKLIGKGKVIRKGNKLLVVEGEICNDTKVIAIATGTFTSYKRK